jgi:hypothetical protein
MEFKVVNFELGTIEKDSVHTVSYPFEGDVSEIVHIAPGCGCTASIEKFDDRIEAIYTESSAKHITPEQIKDQFPSGLLSFSKTLTVYFRDEYDLYVEDGMNKRYNTEKKKVDLLISGKV